MTKNNPFKPRIFSAGSRALRVSSRFAVGDKQSGGLLKARTGGALVADTVLLFRQTEDGGAFFKWGDVKVPVMLDPKDEWQREALDESRYRTKYTRCVKRTIKGQERWFIQVVKDRFVPKRANWGAVSHRWKN